jgi:hypothetical protein
MTGLSRGYRRLLLAYPSAYRRERGDELLDTLLEAAPPGRTRPTAREALDLLRHGLRARLGRPASRSVVTWAVLATVITALFGAAFGARAGWETARPLPDPAATTAMVQEILPGRPWSAPDPPSSAKFIIYGHPLSWASMHDLLMGDGGEYGQAGVGSSLNGSSATDPAATVAEAVTNLESHGWTVYMVRRDDWGTTIAARRGDTVLDFEQYNQTLADTTFVSAGFTRATPPAVIPSALAAGLLTGVVTFLVFAWASRRTEPRHPASGPVKTLFGVTLFLWWAPTLFALPLMIKHHVDEPHPSWHPMWEWLGQPVFSLFFVCGAGCALLALALAALPRRAAAPLTART